MSCKDNGWRKLGAIIIEHIFGDRRCGNVHCGRRLVKKQDFVLVGKDAAQSHSLGFAAGKFQSVFVFQFPQAHIPNEIVASVFVIQARIPAFKAGKVGAGDVYVPFQRHIESVTCLGHITDCVAAAGEVRFKNRVFVGFYQAADNFEHGGFSRSVGTDDRVAFSFFENQSADV